jgi:hypothetical protein
MPPNKFKRHLASVVSKFRDHFRRKLKELNQQKGSFFKQASTPSTALLAFYKVAHRIENCKKPRTIAEDLVLSAAVGMMNIMIGESAWELLSKVPLSNNTTGRRIQLMVLLDKGT